MRPMGGAVSLWMDAPPEKVWALVSDVTRIGEFSPETFEAQWTRDGGTLVTEYFRLEPSLYLRAYWTLLGPLRGRTNLTGMRTTLERMKAALDGADAPST